MYTSFNILLPVQENDGYIASTHLAICTTLWPVSNYTYIFPLHITIKTEKYIFNTEQMLIMNDYEVDFHFGKIVKIVLARSSSLKITDPYFDDKAQGNTLPIQIYKN